MKLNAMMCCRKCWNRVASESMADPIVTVEQGKVKGKTGVDYHGGKFYSFLGIPYAKAPVGELRFKAPQPAEKWDGIKDCTKCGPESPSLDMYFGYHIGNEDNCLNLNVYTKEFSGDNVIKRPVMVWIHGGAFLYGSNNPDLFGPDYLMTQDIVFVNINYRLGILGFLSLKDPTLEVPGNAGLKDMVMALKWIKTNIHQFGGDPNNVTIFGESAGSASVNYLMLSPLTKGLFHKAIMQSGCVQNYWAWGTANASYAAKHLGYKETDEKSILEKLRKESPKSLVKAQHKVRDVLRADDIRPFGPVVEPPGDGAFLTESPLEILKSGRQHQVPLIIGYNSNEGIFFGVLQGVNSQAILPKDMQIMIPFDMNLKKDSEESKTVAAKIKKFYYDGEDATEKNIEKTYLIIGDLCFVYGIQQTINYVAESSTHPVYMYRLSLESSLNYFRHFSLSQSMKLLTVANLFTKLSGSYLPSVKNLFYSLTKKMISKTVDGVSHADDIFYLFPTFYTHPIVKDSEEDVHIQRILKLWTDFAKTGNPTLKKEESLNNVVWEPVDKGNLKMLDIGKELKIIDNVDKERIDFWDDIYRTHAVK